MSPRILLLSLLAVLFFSAPSLHAQRQMEKLGRGVVALCTGTAAANKSVHVSWRMLATDPDSIAFNVYRSANGAPAALPLNLTPITASTNFVDTTLTVTATNAYYVKPVIGGVEGPASAAFTLPANPPIRQYFSVPLQTPPGAYPPYDVKFGWVGDLDGDGEYDFVVDRLSTDTAATHEQYLEAYKRDGTFLWRMNMGPNSVNQYAYEPGSSAISVGDTDNVTVYDLDGDGKAEVIVRTANGVSVTGSTGAAVFTVIDADNNKQFISIINGMTGAELARKPINNPWAQYGTLTNKAAIAYLDGVHPSVLLYGYNRADNAGKFYRVFTTWDYRGGQLTERWSWKQDQSDPATPGGEGHQIRICDVDNDGKDEICDIGHVIDDNGTQLFSTELTHGDRFHITDIDPDRPGLETYAIQQYNPTFLATAYYGSENGAMIKKWYATSLVDVGRGIAIDIDSNRLGLELYSTQPGIYDAKANLAYANTVWPPEGLWWDADLKREVVDGAGSGALSPVVNKFNQTTGVVDRLYTIYNENGGVHQAYGGRPAFWGDILGDWREEIVLMANSYSELRIYGTTIPATNRLPTLMQNPAYRMQATCKGYVQASYPDYYLGVDMDVPAPPPVSDAKLIWKGSGAAGSWDTGTANWLSNWFWTPAQPAAAFANGDSVLFDISGSSQTVNLASALSPASVVVHSPKPYLFSGAGALTGTMALTKAGAGSLTLSGTHSFSGPTLVGGGPLIVNGALTASPIMVRGGVWFDGAIAGTGTFGNGVTIQHAGGISPGATPGTTGTLSITGPLSETGGAWNRFDLTNDANGANDLIKISGNLVLTGTNFLEINPLNGTLTSGTYTLMTYSGTLTGGTANLRLKGANGLLLSHAVSGGKVDLIVSPMRAPGATVWRGSGSAWDLGGSTNWLKSGTVTSFATGDAVTFDATGAASATASLAGTLLPGSVTVNAASTYTFNGPGSLSGTMSLTKSGTGTLIISATNDFTGPTSITGGVVQVSTLSESGYAGALGAAGNAPANLVINGATLRYTGSQAVTDRGLTIGANGATLEISTAAGLIAWQGTIVGSGTGSLKKTGPGAIILNGSNSYATGSTIAGGSVILGDDTTNRYGLGTGAVTLTSGTLTMYDNNGITSDVTSYWNLVIPAGGSGTLRADSRCRLAGTLTGAGTFSFYTPYVRTELQGDWSGFAGTINVTTDSDGGDFRVGNTFGYGNAALNLANLVSAYYVPSLSSPLSLEIGALTGGASAVLMGGPGSTLTWRIGGLNTSTTFPGTIANQGSGVTALTKTGNGTLTISGLNAYTGATTVEAGVLRVSGSLNSASGVVVKNGGTLDLNGTSSIGALQILTGGTLSTGGRVNGAFSNAGTVALTSGTLVLAGPSAVNTGNLRLTGGASLLTSGTFINNGVLDVMTAGKLPSSFVNNGTVITESSGTVQEVSLTGTSAQISIGSFPGHNYQLQRRDSLTTGTWQNVGSPQAGSGATLMFTDPTGGTNERRYYRFTVAP